MKVSGFEAEILTLTVVSKYRPWKCQDVESMESHRTGFPSFPHSLEIPSGLPHYLSLDYRRSF